MFWSHVETCTVQVSTGILDDFRSKSVHRSVGMKSIIWEDAELCDNWDCSVHCGMHVRQEMLCSCLLSLCSTLSRWRIWCVSHFHPSVRRGSELPRLLLSEHYLYLNCCTIAMLMSFRRCQDISIKPLSVFLCSRSNGKKTPLTTKIVNWNYSNNSNVK